MSNKELLNWCVENVEEWGDDFTHIRSDTTGVFYTAHDDWELGCHDARWFEDRISPRYEWVDENLKTLEVGVITKQEWETSKGINKQSSEKSTSNVFTKDMLVPGLHVVETGSNHRYLIMNNNFMIGFPVASHWTSLEQHSDSLKHTNESYTINKVYESKTDSGLLWNNSDEYLTIIWERKEEEKSPTDILYDFELKLSQYVGEGNLEISALTKEFQGIVKDMCKRGLVYKDNVE